MKIAFIGDSFCANYGSGSWLDIVLKEYNAEMLCQGRGGTALFHAYEDLLGIINEADYIILCITDAFRIPNRFGIPFDPTWLSRISWNFKKLLGNPGSFLIGEQHEKAVKAGKWYYNEIMSFEFHQVAQKGILMQMDELMLQKKKKCIWFPCFEDDMSMQSYVPKSGPIANNHLVDVAALPGEAYADKIGGLPGHDSHLNHFNTENNRNMAQVVIDIIETNNFSPHEIKMEDYFEVLK
jgi:hypothetical protein